MIDRHRKTTEILLSPPPVPESNYPPISPQFTACSVSQTHSRFIPFSSPVVACSNRSGGITMKFQPGNKLGKKFQPGQSGNPAGRPPRWKRLARAIDAADDPFVPRGSILMSAGASYSDVLRYDAERDTPPRRRASSPDELAELLDDHFARAERGLNKSLSLLERYRRKRASMIRRSRS